MIPLRSSEPLPLAIAIALFAIAFTFGPQIRLHSIRLPETADISSCCQPLGLLCWTKRMAYEAIDRSFIHVIRDRRVAISTKTSSRPRRSCFA